MDLGLTDKVVLVAGSSRGIGLATAEAFLAEGALVAISGRDSDVLQNAHEQLQAAHPDRVIALAGDLTTREGTEKSVGQVADAWHHPDVVVANIGDGAVQPGWDVTDEDWEAALNTNFLGAMRLVRAALPSMVERGSGAITLVSSIAGRESIGAPLTYASTKSALFAAVGSIARQVGERSVRVNAVAPGNVLFEGGVWDRKLEDDKDRWMTYVKQEVPLQRFGRAEEIADALVFLSSDRSSFVTGEVLVVDGGQTRSM